MRKPQCQWCAKYSSWVTFSSNTFNGALQVSLGLMTTSQALVADGFHSFADAATNLITLGVLKISGKPGDKDHPYGHGKVEFLASSFFGMILLVLSAGIMIRAVVSIVRGDLPPINFIALGPAIISILVNIAIAKYGLCVGREMNSPVVVANAKENVADAFAAIASLAGIIGALMGFPWLDRIAAILVALLIARMGLGIFHEAGMGLMDGSVGEADRQALRRLVRPMPGVEKVALLKTRRIGQKTWADVTIEVPAWMPLHEADRVARDVRNAIMRKFETMQDAVVYLDTPGPVAPPTRTFLARLFRRRKGIA